MQDRDASASNNSAQQLDATQRQQRSKVARVCNHIQQMRKILLQDGAVRRNIYRRKRG
jgi:hypothetical protein